MIKKSRQCYRGFITRIQAKTVFLFYLPGTRKWRKVSYMSIRTKSEVMDKLLRDFIHRRKWCIVNRVRFKFLISQVALLDHDEYP